MPLWTLPRTEKAMIHISVYNLQLKSNSSCKIMFAISRGCLGDAKYTTQLLGFFFNQFEVVGMSARFGTVTYPWPTVYSSFAQAGKSRTNVKYFGRPQSYSSPAAQYTYSSSLLSVALCTEAVTVSARLPLDHTLVTLQLQCTWIHLAVCVFWYSVSSSFRRLGYWLDSPVFEIALVVEKGVKP